MTSIHSLKVEFFTVRNVRLAHTASIADGGKFSMVRWVGRGFRLGDTLKVGEKAAVAYLSDKFMISRLQRLLVGEVPQKRSI